LEEPAESLAEERVTLDDMRIWCTAARVEMGRLATRRAVVVGVEVADRE
jgi:hypothetical protein